MDAGKQKIIQYLTDAHAKELAQVSTLRAHIGIAEVGDYRSRLETHLRETQTHANRVQQRLRELGYQKNPLQVGFGFFQTVIGQSIVMAKAPVDMVRGMDVKEKMLKNARDEMTSEMLEIASYDAIERMANNIGDETTAELAASIRADEERMLENLRAELPNLTDAVVRTQIRGAMGSRTIILDMDELPIADYPDLTADEITARLRDLTQEELAQIEAYETTNQNRQTVLERIDALQEREPWPGYDSLTVDEISSQLTNSSDEIVSRVRDYERGHRDRSSVIKLTERERTDA